MADEELNDVKARAYDTAVALGEEQAKTRVLIGIIKGLTEGTIAHGNVEVNEGATRVTIKDADLVPAAAEEN